MVPGRCPARQAALKGGIPLTVPSTAVNKACPSGLNAIALSHRQIAVGEAELCVAGGMESMTQAPYLLQQGRGGYRYGDATMHDSLTLDGLYCSIEHELMGAGTERYAAAEGMARGPHGRVLGDVARTGGPIAQKDGLLAEEIVPVTVPQRRGDDIVVSDDEGHPGGHDRGVARRPQGRLRWGRQRHCRQRQSQISDGGAATVVTTKAKADALGVEPLAEIISLRRGRGPGHLAAHPARAGPRMVALERAGLTVSDVDLFEFNEAFAAVAVASMADLSIPDDIVNVNGGAIALGHPIGMSRRPHRHPPRLRTQTTRRGDRRRRPVRRRRTGRRHRDQGRWLIMATRDYITAESGGLTIHWDSSLCYHAAECVKAQPLRVRPQASALDRDRPRLRRRHRRRDRCVPVAGHSPTPGPTRRTMPRPRSA